MWLFLGGVLAGAFLTIAAYNLEWFIYRLTRHVHS